MLLPAPLLLLGDLRLAHERCRPLVAVRIAGNVLRAPQIPVADGSSKRIGAVVGVRVMIERKHLPHHEYHLMLVGGTGADDSLLDLHRRVLADLEPLLCRSDKCRSSCMRCRYGRAAVLCEEDLLDSKLGGLELDDRVVHVLVDAAQPLVERLVCPRLDAALGTGTADRAPCLNDAPARMRKAGIDADDDHGNPRTTVLTHTMVAQTGMLQHAAQERTEDISSPRTAAPTTGSRGGS